VAARIRSSTVGEQLVAALEDWALVMSGDYFVARFRLSELVRRRGPLPVMHVQCTAERRSEECIEQEPIGMSRHLGIVGVTTASRFSPC
jgi:hypothetical protein